ncbi:MAG: twin-arginine translocation signal domain-containing protein [Desulfobacterales bacterium]|nr:twin-arginine translocation signal domain-containing protein [Desulfobacterales bacterium]
MDRRPNFFIFCEKLPIFFVNDQPIAAQYRLFLNPRQSPAWVRRKEQVVGHTISRRSFLKAGFAAAAAAAAGLPVESALAGNNDRGYLATTVRPKTATPIPTMCRRSRLKRGNLRLTLTGWLRVALLGGIVLSGSLVAMTNFPYVYLLETFVIGLNLFH